MSQVISANRLSDGIIVFLASGHRWVESLQAAEVFPDAATTRTALERVADDVKGNFVIEVAAFDVNTAGGRIEARHLRDRIRVAGPTVHPDHGKQAQPV